MSNIYGYISWVLPFKPNLLHTNKLEIELLTTNLGGLKFVFVTFELFSIFHSHSTILNLILNNT
jgi:hypothetical protein